MLTGSSPTCRSASSRSRCTSWLERVRPSGCGCQSGSPAGGSPRSARKSRTPRSSREPTYWPRSSALAPTQVRWRSEEHTSELQSRFDLVCRLLLDKKKQKTVIESETAEMSVQDTDTG